MSNKLLLSASLALAATAGSAFANEARVLDSAPVAATPGQTYITVGGGYEFMQMPEHGNGVLQFDFDGVGDVSPQFLQTDIEGWGWSGGFARDIGGGWRIGGFLRGVEAEGEASATYTVPNTTPFRHGLLNGTQNGAGNYGGPGTTEQALTVNYDGMFGTVTFGRGFGGVRGDVLVSFGDESTDYHNVQDDITFNEFHLTDTSFDVSTIELAARLATSFPLGTSFSLDLAGSVGGSFKDIDMSANTIRDLGAPVLSSITVSDDDTALLGTVSASLVWAVTTNTALSLNAGWTYDGGVPVYIAPNFATGAAATFDTEEQQGAYVGVRWGRHW